MEDLFVKDSVKLLTIYEKLLHQDIHDSENSKKNYVKNSTYPHLKSK